MRTPAYLFAMSAFLCWGALELSPLSAEDRVSSGQPDFRAPFQNDKHCGPNSLYALLRLYGVDVDHERLTDSISLDDRGCSVGDLQKAASEIGVRLEAVRVRPEQLRQSLLPAIVHYGTSPGDTGHFFVLLNIEQVGEDQFMQTIDGSDGQFVVRAPMGQFFREWDGVLLVVSRESNSLSWGWSAAGCLLVINAFVYAKYALVRKSS